MAGRASSASRPGCTSRAPTRSMPPARRCRPPGSSSTAWPSRVAISGGCRSSSASGCLELLVPARGVARYCEHVEGGGAAFFEAVGELGLEGIVAKRAASRLRGRTLARLAQGEVRAPPEEFVIGGYTAPQGSRGYFGALHLGLYEGGSPRLRVQGGDGFDEQQARRDRETPRAARPRHLTVRGRARRRAAGITGWSRGSSAEVRFIEWTADGGIRHPDLRRAPRR